MITNRFLIKKDNVNIKRLRPLGKLRKTSNIFAKISSMIMLQKSKREGYRSDVTEKYFICSLFITNCIWNYEYAFIILLFSWQSQSDFLSPPIPTTYYAILVPILTGFTLGELFLVSVLLELISRASTQKTRRRVVSRHSCLVCEGKIFPTTVWSLRGLTDHMWQLGPFSLTLLWR